jgi:hypothetical protein
MKKTLSIAILSAAFSVMALAENWSGTLLDASCYEKSQKAEGCEATGTTTSFALSASGKVLKLDSAGNTKAASALKSRADHVADPAKPESKQVMAKVDGTEQGGTIAVTSIDIQ